MAQQTKSATEDTVVVKADSLFAISEWKKAADLYESVLKKNAGNAKVYSSLGYCYHQLKQYSRAVEKYRLCLKGNQDPGLSNVTLIRLARTYAVLRDYNNAIGSLDKALELGYNKAGELDKETDFDGLRADPRFVAASNKARENAFPCMKQTQLREFDFWIGEWTAFVTGTSFIAGYSRIELASGGCMILENWTSAGNVPFSGKSINFIDGQSGKWKQVWIGSNAPAVSEFLNGIYQDGAMRFEFQEKTPAGNNQFVKFIFYNEGPDQVRQHHQTSTDDGKTWNTTYDFTYKRNRE